MIVSTNTASRDVTGGRSLGSCCPAELRSSNENNENIGEGLGMTFRKRMLVVVAVLFGGWSSYYLLADYLFAEPAKTSKTGGNDPAPPQFQHPRRKKADTAEVGQEKPKLFVGWEQPKVALVISGHQHGYVEPCGCTGVGESKRWFGSSAHVSAGTSRERLECGAARCWQSSAPLWTPGRTTVSIDSRIAQRNEISSGRLGADDLRLSAVNYCRQSPAKALS